MAGAGPVWRASRRPASPRRDLFDDGDAGGERRSRTAGPAGPCCPLVKRRAARPKGQARAQGTRRSPVPQESTHVKKKKIQISKDFISSNILNFNTNLMILIIHIKYIYIYIFIHV